MKTQIRKLASSEPLPCDLLLLADETMDAIDKYVHESTVYVMEQGSVLIGVYVLYPHNTETVEIKNIAVAKEYQNRGFGKRMLQDIKRRAQGLGFKEIIIGTADVAAKQIKLYKSVGFHEFKIKENFFIDNYTTPIYENSTPLKDMIMLRKQLTP